MVDTEELEVTNKGDFDHHLFAAIGGDKIFAEYIKFRQVIDTEDGLFGTILYACLETCFQLKKARPLKPFFQMLNTFEKEKIFNKFCYDEEMILDVKDYVRQVTNRWIMGKHSMRQLANMSINNTMFQPITVLYKMFEYQIQPTKIDLNSLETKEEHRAYFDKIITKVGEYFNYNLRIIYLKKNSGTLLDYGPQNPIPKEHSFGSISIFINQGLSNLLYSTNYEETLSKLKSREYLSVQEYNKLLNILGELIFKGGLIIDYFPESEQHNLVYLVEELYSIGLKLHWKTPFSDIARGIGKMFNLRSKENYINCNILTIIMEAYYNGLLYTKEESREAANYKREEQKNKPKERRMCQKCQRYESPKLHRMDPHYFCFECIVADIKEELEGVSPEELKLTCPCDLCLVPLTDNLNEMALQLVNRLHGKLPTGFALTTKNPNQMPGFQHVYTNKITMPNIPYPEDISQEIGNSVAYEIEEKVIKGNRDMDTKKTGTFSNNKNTDQLADNEFEEDTGFIYPDSEEEKVKIYQPPVETAASNVKKKCHVCDKENAVEKVWLLYNCQHEICNSCALFYINNLIAKEETCIHDLICPKEGCKTQLHNLEIKGLIGKELFEQMSMRTSEVLQAKMLENASQKKCIIF